MPMRAGLIKGLVKWVLVIAALGAFVFQAAGGQGGNSSKGAGAKATTSGPENNATGPNNSDVANTLKTAAEALGLAWGGECGGSERRLLLCETDPPHSRRELRRMPWRLQDRGRPPPRLVRDAHERWQRRTRPPSASRR